MVAALNVYRQVVNGQRTPANVAANQTVQQRQAALQVVPGGQPGQFVPQQQPMQMQAQYAPQQYAQQAYAQQQQLAYQQAQMAQQAQQRPLTPHEQRQMYRAQYAQSAMRAQAQMQQQQASAQNWYNQWQQGGMGPGQPQQPQYGMPQAQYGQPQFAPPMPMQQGFVQQGQWQQPQVPQYQAPALQQAVQGGMPSLPSYAQPIQHFASRADEQLFEPGGNFNPVAFGGWRGALQGAVPDPRQRMFGANNQLNADNSRDALVQIKHVLTTAGREARFARFNRQAQQMMTEERRQILAAATQDPEGFAIMGQELLLPIKDLVDYEGWARKVYRVRPLAQGELFRIAKDVRSTAWVIGQDGQGLEARLFGRYVTPSEFKIGSFPTVDIEDIYQMNYDVLDRAQDTARQEIELEEDKRGRALIDVAAQTVNAVTSFTSLGVAAFEDVRYQVERHRLVVEKFLINRAELSDIVKTMSSQVDPVTERELILAGYIGSFLNAVIITSAGTQVEEVVPAGTFYAVTGPEYMGEMGIRVELFSEPFNMFSQFRFVKGWAFGEIIGFVISNPRACAKGMK